MGDRIRQHGAEPQLNDPSGPGGDNLDSLRETSSGLHEASDAIIERNLSGNPEAFLSARRQSVGQ